ncbi:MAG: DUF3109 family protein [Candidatus Saccharimonadaceae bacterium]
MLQIDDTIISMDVIEKHFICDLCKCKGQCCVDGESGAPLEKDENEKINEILPTIWNELSPKAQALINEQGISYEDYDGELVTSIINGNECVFTYFDENGVCKCVIDKAYREGRIPIQKPISCHLYPIRLQKYRDFTAVNYHNWSVCKPAIKLGKKEGVPLFKFLKEPLTRKFGEQWYENLCDAVRLMEQEKE